MNSKNSIVLLLFVATAMLQLHHPHAKQSFDYPTAKPSTSWTNSQELPHTIQYPDGTTIKSLLLRSPQAKYGPSFACGFYCRSALTRSAGSTASPSCTDYLFAVFIVYTNSGALITNVNTAIPQVVWSANRNRPVGENAVLKFASDGNLLLMDANGTLVWSTNTTGHSVVSMSITETGNLVLVDRKGATTWQSFDRPTDTLLPGQTLVDGQTLFANVSRYNWSEGLYALTSTSSGFRAAVRTDPPQLYFQDGVSSSSPSGSTGNYLMFQNGSLSFFKRSSNHPSSLTTLPPAPSAQYMRLELDGHLRVYQWRIDGGGWKAVADVIQFYSVGDCGFPTACGSYGICSLGQCSCPRDANNWMTNYFLPIRDRRPDLGCEAVVPISPPCSRRGWGSQYFLSKMLRLEDISYFAYVDDALVVKGVKGMNACAWACLRDCSCRGAFFQYGNDPAEGRCYAVTQVLTMRDHDSDAMHYNSTGFVKVQFA